MQSPLEPYRDLLPSAPTIRALGAGIAVLAFCLGQLAEELDAPGRLDDEPAGPEADPDPPGPDAPSEFDLDDQAEMIGPTSAEYLATRADEPRSPLSGRDVPRLLNPRPLAS